MIALKYGIFAIISTVINIIFQYFSFSIYTGVGSLYLAMSVGTLSGLVCKYILDKKYIFYHTTNNKMDDAKTFTLYSLMGIVTTVIFWVTEISFDIIFADERAKYAGAIIGLSIGYTVKYFLDKKYVFRASAS
jgi:putative flippase GtrA